MKNITSNSINKFFTTELVIISCLGLPAIINTFLGQNIRFKYYLISYIIILFTCLMKKKPKLLCSIKNISLKSFNLLIVISFLTITVFKYVPIINHNAPPLHDPVSHAYLSKHISEIGKVDYFYSPFLHTSIAFINQILNTPTPKLILFTNSFFLSLIPLNIYLLLYALTNDKPLSFSVSIATSISPVPNDLFYTAGKNTLIFAIFLITISSYFLFIYTLHRSLRNYLLLYLSIVTLYFTHYPALSLYLFMIIPVILTNIYKSKNKKQTIIPYVFVLVSLLIISIYWNNKFSSNIAINTSLTNTSDSISITQIGLNTLNSFTNTFQQISNRLKTSSINIVLLFLILSYILPKNYESKYRLLWTLSILFCLYILITSFISIFINLEILTETAGILGILFVTIVLVLLLSTHLINKKWYVFTHYIFILLIGLAYYALNSRSTLIKLNPVSDYDLQAFNFINNNINNNESFISGSIISNNILYPTDSGMWIPTYTENKIATDFGDRGEQSTIENSELINQIIKDEKDDSLTVKKLVDKGYNYAYLDKGVFGPSLNLNNFNKIKFEIMYSNPEVTIIKFLKD